MTVPTMTWGTNPNNYYRGFRESTSYSPTYEHWNIKDPGQRGYSGKGGASMRDHENWQRKVQASGAVAKLENWAKNIDWNKFVSKDQVSEFYQDRINQIESDIAKANEAQDQRWATWNARWDASQQPQLLNVGGEQLTTQQALNQQGEAYGSRFDDLESQLAALQANQNAGYTGPGGPLMGGPGMRQGPYGARTQRGLLPMRGRSGGLGASGFFNRKGMSISNLNV